MKFIDDKTLVELVKKGRISWCLTSYPHFFAHLIYKNLFFWINMINMIDICLHGDIKC